MSPEALADFLTDLYGSVLESRALMPDAEFKFTRSASLDDIEKNTERSLVRDFDRVKKKVLKAWNDVSMSEEQTLQEKEADIVINTVSGRELTVSVIQGLKSSYLFGFRGIATGLGFKDGDKGKKGIFRFDYMSPEAFKRAKKSAEKVSKGTLDIMCNGDSNKFKRRNIRNIIVSGIQEGKPSTDVAAELGALFDKAKYWKASEIARTELANAYNYGRIDAARRDGIKKARIELGGRPCEWCIAHHTDVHTLDDAEVYFDDHHPINDCTVIPLVSFEDYGIEPPPGYEDYDEGPIG